MTHAFGRFVTSNAGAAVVALALVIAPAAAKADAPHFLSQQGRLLDVAGRPITGTVKIRFSLYTQPDGGDPFWTEAIDVPLTDGYFDVVLGRTVALDPARFDGLSVFLGFTVQDDPEMSPREEIVSVPYALVAGDVRGDIHPGSVSVGGNVVIDQNGNWVGPSAGLAGAPGKDGQSVSSTAVPVGDATCPYGGVQFSVAGQSTFACNGAPGAAGTAGAPGESVTALALSAGDPTCPYGGVRFTIGRGR